MGPFEKEWQKTIKLLELPAGSEKDAERLRLIYWAGGAALFKLLVCETELYDELVDEFKIEFQVMTERKQ